jgi:choline dehydrogenase
LEILGLSGTGAVAAQATSCATEEVLSGDDAELAAAETFEYIVVGSGAGGGPLVANLARQGHKGAAARSRHRSRQ